MNMPAMISDFFPHMTTEEVIWVTIGLLGQSMFFLRFLVQWITSEKQKKCVIPYCFWYFSIAGSLIVLAYGFWRKDPVIIVGQLTGCIIYLRNLYLIHHHPKQIDPQSLE